MRASPISIPEASELLEALKREQGTLIEVMLDPEVITTRGTLSAITDAALKKQK